jgi:alpha-glucuronidase
VRTFAFFLAMLFGLSAAAHAEDGYDLWLRYKPVGPEWISRYAPHARSIVLQGQSPTLAAARDELGRGLSGLLGYSLPLESSIGNGAILLGTPASSPMIRNLHLPLKSVGAEGYLIRSTIVNGRRITVIAANSDVGVLYGTFALLRRIQTRQPLANLKIASSSSYSLRVLDHWDNLDRTVERGYAGASIWDWASLPKTDQR